MENTGKKATLGAKVGFFTSIRVRPLESELLKSVAIIRGNMVLKIDPQS